MKKFVSFIFILYMAGVILPDSNAQDMGRASYDLGVFAFEEGNYKQAETHFKNALSANPANPVYNHYLGKTYLKTGQIPEAEKYLRSAWDTDPNLYGLKYDIAVLSYKIGDYSRSYELFNELSEDITARFYAGMSLFNLQRYNEAAGFFDTAAKQSPALKAEALYYSGICDMKTGRKADAIEKFTFVKENAASDTLKGYAVRWLEGLKQEKKTLKPYSIYLKAGYAYDDNVQLEPIDEDRYADEDDYVLRGYFSGSYDFISREKYSVGIGYSHYQTWHKDLEEYDIAGSIGNLSVTYRSYPFKTVFAYIPSHYWLDGDQYMMRHQFKNELTWHMNKKFAARFSFDFFKNTYFENDDSDGCTTDLGFDVYYIFKKGYISAGVGYEDVSADHMDQQYIQLKAKLGASFQLPLGFVFSFTGKYTDKEYDHVDSDFGFEREDVKYYGSASLSRALFYEWLSIIAEYNYTKNDSNNVDYEYERNSAALSMAAKF